MTPTYVTPDSREPCIELSVDGKTWFITSLGYNPKYLHKDLKFRTFKEGEDEMGCGICYYKSKREAQNMIRKWEKAYP